MAHYLSNMTLSISFLLFYSMSLIANEAGIVVDRDFAVETLVTNYVNGFKEFDTSVVVLGDAVSVSIYISRNGQSEKSAKVLKARFEEQLPKILDNYEWSKDIKLFFRIYRENR